MTARLTLRPYAGKVQPIGSILAEMKATKPATATAGATPTSPDARRHATAHLSALGRNVDPTAAAGRVHRDVLLQRHATIRPGNARDASRTVRARNVDPTAVEEPVRRDVVRGRPATMRPGNARDALRTALESAAAMTDVVRRVPITARIPGRHATPKPVNVKEHANRTVRARNVDPTAVEEPVRRDVVRGRPATIRPGNVSVRRTARARNVDPTVAEAPVRRDVGQERPATMRQGNVKAPICR